MCPRQRRVQGRGEGESLSQNAGRKGPAELIRISSGLEQFALDLVAQGHTQSSLEHFPACMTA